MTSSTKDLVLSDGLFYVPLCLTVLVALRILRVAATAASSTRPVNNPISEPTRSCGWLKARKLIKLASTTALSRAHTELFHSKIDEIQARHDLEQLVAELEPPAETAPTPRHRAAAPDTAALTLAEIQDLLAVVDIDEHTRADLLRLAAARLAEKRS